MAKKRAEKQKPRQKAKEPAPEQATKKAQPLELILACPRCGGTHITYGVSQTISCPECGFRGQPKLFASQGSWREFRAERELAKMPEGKLWDQKVMHGTVPVVVLVNWATALFFTIFFSLGMAGFFKSEAFQWAFLYSSIAVVAFGFGVLSRWGKKRISF